NLQPQHIVRDENGRPLDGEDKTSGNTFRIINDQRTRAGWFEAELPDGERVFYLHNKGKRSFEATGYFEQFSSLDDLKERLASEETPAGAMQELAFYHNCRDLNPAALITSLQSEFSDPGN